MIILFTAFLSYAPCHYTWYPQEYILHDSWGAEILSLVGMGIVFDCCTELVQESRNLG